MTVIPPAPMPEETFQGPLTLQAHRTCIEIQFRGDSHQMGASL